MEFLDRFYPGRLPVVRDRRLVGTFLLSSGSSFDHGSLLGSLGSYIRFRVRRASDQGDGGHQYDHGGEEEYRLDVTELGDEELERFEEGMWERLEKSTE